MIDTDKLMALVTVDYDRADKALDKITFVECAVSQMMSSYQDSVVNGLVEVLDESEAELRRYMEATRTVLLQIESEQGETESVQR